ncbi:MAG: response regulator [Geminicoccales bacterium]
MLRGLRLLVVEDEFFIARDIGFLLRRAGADVVGPLGRLTPALSAARSELVDGAVLDLDLHGERVYPVADALAARGVPFLFLSGFDDEAIDSQYHHVPRLEKPFTPDQLISAATVAFARRPMRGWPGG